MVIKFVGPNSNVSISICRWGFRWY